MTIIGHRGYAARYPENTIPSLEGAIAAGARAVEWDVHVAACGTPVLFHDDTLERTTDGTGPLSALPFSELVRLDAGRWFAPGFQGTRIPSLEEALRAVVGRVDAVYCEVKRVRAPEDLDRIGEILLRTGAESRTVLISLDPAILEAARLRIPKLALGWVVSAEEGIEAAAERVRRDGNALLDPDYRLLLADPERTRGWVKEGMRLACWTVDDAGAAEALVRLGVRHLTTNRVTDLLTWARSTGASPA